VSVVSRLAVLFLLLLIGLQVLELKPIELLIHVVNISNDLVITASLNLPGQKIRSKLLKCLLLFLTLPLFFLFFVSLYVEIVFFNEGLIIGGFVNKIVLHHIDLPHYCLTVGYFLTDIFKVL
jgi:hypothetical protein